MSGDVQPRRRNKDNKKKKKDDDLDFDDINIHVQKDMKIGGNMFAQVFFALVFGALICMVGLIVIEHRKSGNEVQTDLESPWSQLLEGWVEDHKDEHDAHDHSAHNDDLEDDHQDEDEAFENSREISENKRNEELEDIDQDDDDEDDDSSHNEEEEDDDLEEDRLQSNLPPLEEDVEQTPNEEEEGAGNSSIPQAPLPPSSPSPVYVEEILPEQITPIVPIDRRATLVEPGEVVLPQSDIEDSDLEEYEEEEEISQGSDREPIRDSTVVTYEYSPVESEPEEEELEEEEELSENSAPINDKWASVPRQDLNSEDEVLGESGSEIEYSDNEPTSTVQSKFKGPKSTEDYIFENITNEQDWEIRDQLDAAEDQYNQSNLEQSLHQFEILSKAYPTSPRSLFGVAKCLDLMAEKKKSNSILEAAIIAYLTLLAVSNIPGPLVILAAQRCIDRGRFKGSYQKIIAAHQILINRFPDNPKFRNDLSLTYLMMARNTNAKHVLEELLIKWPEDGMAHAGIGFIYKQEEKYEKAVYHLMKGIHSREFEESVEAKNRGKYYYVLGDALQRLGRNDEAHQIYTESADKGLFKSAYQRSIHNVDRLTAKPWWTPEETTYSPFFRKLERNWKKIRDEALNVLKLKDKASVFKNESETLVDLGDWKQFDLFARGNKIERNCKLTPFTCNIVGEFPPAYTCSRGQIKFSIIHPNTHVWPHCGPTNCRLRAHLGLVIPKLTGLRVVNETRSWEEGKVLVFDDSFEHEVWHNGSTFRLILIVDVWHPELTSYEKKTLKPI